MLLAQILTWITGVRRYKPEIEWRSGSWVYNAFRLYELIFWRREGVRCETITRKYYCDGRAIQERYFFTTEAILVHFEHELRQRLGHYRFEFEYVPVRQLAIAGPTGISLAPFYSFAIAYGTAAHAADNSQSSVNIGPITPSGSNIFISAGYEGTTAGSDAVTSAAWNTSGTATKLDNYKGSGGRFIGVYYKEAPTNTTASWTFSASSTDILGGDVAQYSGVAQSSSIDPLTGGTGTGYKRTDASSVTTFSMTIATTVNGAWQLGFAHGANPSAGSGTTIRSSGNGYGWGDSNAAIAVAGSNTINFTSTTASWSSISFAIKPVAGTAYTKTLTETVTNTDSVLKTATKLLTQTITNTDTLIKTATRTLAEAITNSATFLAQIVHASTLSDTITNTDAFLRSITHVLAETISNADTVLKTAGRTVSETVTNTASLLKTAGKMLLETITSTDVFTEGLTVSVGPNSPGTTTDDSSIGTFAWANPGNAQVSDNVYSVLTAIGATSFYAGPNGTGVVDGPVKLVKGGTISGSDLSASTNLSTSDTYISYGGPNSLWGLSWTPSEINNSNFGAAFAVMDSKDGASQSHYLKATNFAFSIPAPATISGIKVQVEAKADVAAFSVHGDAYVDHVRITVYYVISGNLYSQTLTDALTTADTLIKIGTKLLSEAITNTGTFIRSTSRTLTEAITNSDTLTKLRTAFSTLTEAIVNADGVIKLPGKVLIETVSAADTIVRTVARTLSEALTPVATFIRSMTRTLTEAIGTADTFLAQIVHASTLTEALTATDTFLRTMARSFTEAITNTDTFTAARVLPFTFSEILTGTDSLIRSAGKTLIDGITQTASVIRSVGRTLLETVTNTDVFTAARSRIATLTEALISLDAVFRSVGRTLSEAITNTDIFAASRVLVRAYSETVTNTATILRTVGRAIMESVATSATFSRVLTATRTFTETVTLTPLFKALRNGYDVFWVNVSKSATSLVNAAKSGASTITNVVRSASRPTNVAKSAAGAITNAARSAASWINQDRT